MKAKVIFDGGEVEAEFTQEQLEKIGFVFQKITNYQHRPRVEKGERFCFIDYEGIIKYCDESNGDFEERLYLFGNYFHTESEAITKRNEILAKQKADDEEITKPKQEDKIEVGDTVKIYDGIFGVVTYIYETRPECDVLVNGETCILPTDVLILIKKGEKK